MKSEIHFFLVLFIAELRIVPVTQKELVWLLTYTDPLRVCFKLILPSCCFMRDDQCPPELSVTEMDGYQNVTPRNWKFSYLTLSSHRRPVAAVLEDTGTLSFTVERDEGEATLSFRHSYAAHLPSGVSLKHQRYLCRSSHLFYEYSRKIPYFKFQLTPLLAVLSFSLCYLSDACKWAGRNNQLKQDGSESTL